MGHLRSRFGWAWLLVLIPALALTQILKGVDHQSWTKKYDRHFRKYAKHYFGPGFDWRWFKAQAIAESTLKPDARSSAGAVGLMQILASTFAEIQERNPGFKNVLDPRWNIAAGIYYDRQLYRRWAEHVEGDQKLSFAFASYNAGFGKVRRAFRRAQKAGMKVPSWKTVAPHAPRPTRRYVRRIHRLMGRDIGA
jgi:membrane-bound lytic murein transglycosylase MltF